MPVDLSDDLDELIEHTARSLSDLSPRASLREGVRVRIAGTRQWWRVPGWQPALASALVVAVVALLWPPRSVDSPARRSAPGAAPAEVGSGVAEAADRARLQVPATAATVGRIGVGAVARSPLPRPVPGATIVAPLEITPIASDLIVVEAMSPPMPMALQPVEIEPLTFQ